MALTNPDKRPDFVAVAGKGYDHRPDTVVRSIERILGQSPAAAVYLNTNAFKVTNNRFAAG
jgi:hypothetical protein